MTNLSLGASKTVRGYIVEKLPIGNYLKAMESLKNLPNEFLNTCVFSTKGMGLLETLATLDENKLMSMASAFFSVAPAYFVSFVATLLDISEEAILEDEQLGLDGFLELIVAFLEVNRLGKCLEELAAIKLHFRQLTQQDGFLS